MSHKVGTKLVRWTGEEDELVEAYAVNNKMTRQKDAENLAKTINEVIWDGKVVRNAKAITVRVSALRRKMKKPEHKPEPTKTPPAEPEAPASITTDSVTMPELGEAVYEYIRFLKNKCSDLGLHLSSELQNKKQIAENYKGIIKEKDAIIASLNRKIQHLNSEIYHGNLGKTFSIGEVMKNKPAQRR